MEKGRLQILTTEISGRSLGEQVERLALSCHRFRPLNLPTSQTRQIMRLFTE